MNVPANYTDTLKKIRAAQKLMTGSATSEKVKSVRTLLAGVNPNLDTLLQVCEQQITVVEQLGRGAVDELAVGQLPEGSEEEKQRKKALVLFFKYWNELKTEVERVRAEMQAHQPGMWGRIFGGAKGPLVIVAVLVVAAVAYLHVNAVEVLIENAGCDTLYPTLPVSINIPGVKLSNEPLLRDESRTVVLPPLKFTADFRLDGQATVTVLGQTFSVTVPNADVMLFDDKQVLGEKVDVDLGSSKHHSLTVICVRE